MSEICKNGTKEKVNRMEDWQRRAVEVMRKLEWSVTYIIDEYLPAESYRCPTCGKPKFRGHRDDCALAALLREAEGAE